MEAVNAMVNDKSNNKIFIGNKIKIQRKQKGYTQEQLAEMLNVSTHTISRYECGRNFPSHEHMLLLSKILDLSIEDSYYGYQKINESISIDELNNLLKTLSPNNQEIAILVMKYLCELLQKTEPIEHKSNNDT